MSKTRKTRKEKIQSTKRAAASSGFKISTEWLKDEIQQEKVVPVMSKNESKYFRADLTKTFFLTMLVLALEIALWQYLSRH